MGQHAKELLGELAREQFLQFTKLGSECLANVREVSEAYSVYHDKLQRTLIQAALLARPLPLDLIRRLQEWTERRIEYQQAVKRRSTLSSASMESILTITGSAVGGKDLIVAVGHAILLVATADCLEICGSRRKTGVSKGPAVASGTTDNEETVSELCSIGLEMLFTSIKYRPSPVNNNPTNVNSEMATLDRVDYGEGLERLVSVMGSLSPNLLYSAVTDAIGQSLLKPAKHEFLIRSLSRLSISLFPLETFLTNIAFLERLAVKFTTVHGSKLKEAYMTAFSGIFQQAASRIDAEANLMEWRDVVEGQVYRRLQQLLSKPRYHTHSARLLGSCLLVSGVDFFREHWRGGVELIITRIRERYLEVGSFLLVNRILWVYLFRCGEAWATMANDIEQVHRSVASIAASLPPDLYCEFLVICAAKLPRPTFNELLLPLLSPGSIMAGPSDYYRMQVSLSTFYRLISMLQRRLVRPDFPSGLWLPFDDHWRVQRITEDFLSDQLQHDPASMLQVIEERLGRLIGGLEEQQLLWQPGLWEGRARDGPVPRELSDLMRLVFYGCPEVCPVFSDPRQFAFLLTKYCYLSSDPPLAEAASLALLRYISTVLSMDCEENARRWEVYFWALSGSLEMAWDRACEGRQTALLRLGDLFAVKGRAWRYLPVTERMGILGESLARVYTASLDVRLRDAVGKVLASMVPFVMDLSEKVEPSGNVDPDADTGAGTGNDYEDADSTKGHLQLKITSSVIVHVKALGAVFAQLINGQPLMPGPFADGVKVSVARRLGDLHSLVSNPRDRSLLLSPESESLIDIYGEYISFFMQYGPITGLIDLQRGRQVRKRPSASSLDSLSSTKLEYEQANSRYGPLNKMRSIQSICQLVLPGLLHDIPRVRQAVIHGLARSAPLYLTEIVYCLVPYGKMISEDLRNMRYRFSRRNRKSDQLKIDLTSLLAGLLTGPLQLRTDLFSSEGGRTQTPSIHYLLKSLLETFYFCSEIDTDCTLPALRVNLCRMVRGWAAAVLSLAKPPNVTARVRFQYLPFKLHSEMWLSMFRWTLERQPPGPRQRLSLDRDVPNPNPSPNLSNASSNPNTEESHGGDGRALAGHHGPLTYTWSLEEEEQELTEAMKTLSMGLQSPSAGNRQDGVSLGQILRWTDLLIGRGRERDAREALSRLLESNPAVSDRILDKAFLSCPSPYLQAITCPGCIDAERGFCLELFQERIRRQRIQYC